MTLGSLFDGSGGFPLAGVLNGITPIWSSEIEAFPLKVTAARFPKVKQLGDVTKIDGAAIEPVDIITFGSPCQDLSVAGKQAGIHDGERSNLFFEAVRIIREMREHDENNGRTDKHVRPRFAVWENVPGAFSSNRGADFKAVLDALCRVKDPVADVSQPKKWGGAGCVVGDGYSVAWRVYDAQYWGVPQRRKRIYLVADFGSERAGEILFEREGLRGDSAESGAAREGTAADAERGAGGSYLFEPMSLMEENWSEQTVKNALRENASKSSCCVVQDNVKCLNPWDYQNKRQHDINSDGVTAPTITGDHENRVTDYSALAVGNGQLHQTGLGDKIGALNCMHDQQAVIHDAPPPRRYIIRRLTPLECCRLQGFPDWWDADVEGSDSARYKMWGNGIALPCAADVLRRIAEFVRKGDDGDGSASVTVEKPEPSSVAHWVRERGRVRHWHCSECGYVTGLAGLTYKYCPECGAELEERHYEID